MFEDLPQALKNGVFIGAVDRKSSQRLQENLNSRVPTKSQDRESRGNRGGSEKKEYMIEEYLKKRREDIERSD